MPSKAPTVGQHTDEVLRAVLGYDDARVDGAARGRRPGLTAAAARSRRARRRVMTSGHGSSTAQPPASAAAVTTRSTASATTGDSRRASRRAARRPAGSRLTSQRAHMPSSIHCASAGVGRPGRRRRPPRARRAAGPRATPRRARRRRAPARPGRPGRCSAGWRRATAAHERLGSPGAAGAVGLDDPSSQACVHSMSDDHGGGAVGSPSARRHASARTPSGRPGRTSRSSPRCRTLAVAPARSTSRVTVTSSVPSAGGPGRVRTRRWPTTRAARRSPAAPRAGGRRAVAATPGSRRRRRPGGRGAARRRSRRPAARWPAWRAPGSASRSGEGDGVDGMPGPPEQGHRVCGDLCRRRRRGDHEPVAWTLMRGCDRLARLIDGAGDAGPAALDEHPRQAGVAGDVGGQVGGRKVVDALAVDLDRHQAHQRGRSP